MPRHIVARLTPRVPIERADAFCIVFRTGTRERYRWQRSDRMTLDAAVASTALAEAFGAEAHVERYCSSLAVGLPYSFDYDPPLHLMP